MPLEMPSSIDVEVPSHYNDTAQSFRGISMFTKLFREGCHLSEAVEQMYARDREIGAFTVVSAGCSIGAELDSVLALHAASDQGAQLRAVGFDSNPIVIRAAHEGRYSLLRDYAEHELAEIQEQLQKYGFATDYDPTQTDRDFFGRISIFNIDAAPLRRNHKVSFEIQDLRDGVPLETDADLVLANNLLYHLTPTDATEVAQHLASTLNESGVLSINSLKRYPSRQMAEDGTPDPTRYAQWLSGIVDRLRNQFGLRPIPLDEEVERSVIMFARA